MEGAGRLSEWGVCDATNDMTITMYSQRGFLLQPFLFWEEGDAWYAGLSKMMGGSKEANAEDGSAPVQ